MSVTSLDHAASNHQAISAKKVAPPDVLLTPLVPPTLRSTPPQELYAIINQDQKFWYDVLLKLPAMAILELTNVSFGLPAIHAVLQTWNHRLDYHSHSHFIVSNGGMRDGQWVEPRNVHWLPTDYISCRLKGLVLAHIKNNKHRWSDAMYQHIEKRVIKGHWKVDCSPYGSKLIYDQDEHGNDRVELDHEKNLEKLLNYVHRDCLAGHRIICIDDEYVTIEYKHHNQDRYEQETISGVEYIERFMQHVLPRRFHSVRSYGLLHASKKVELQHAKKLFDKQRRESGTFIDRWLNRCEQALQEQSDKVFGSCCNHCGNKTLKNTRVFFQDFKQTKPYFAYGVARASPDIPYH